MEGERVSVAVLGGGVGGLTAAHELAERDFDVTVFEAGDRLGGKASSFMWETDENGVSLPAEHGFRYFPGFYRNLRETLARIPIPEGGTVADNLVSTKETLVASVSDAETLKRTQTPTSVSELMAAIRPSVASNGLSFSEINYFQSRLLLFLTSGRFRRERELENITLWEYLDADARSAAYRQHLAEITQALVAMQPQVASARSICQIHVQLALDQIDPNRTTESVLNGPTSEVWIEPWVTYLESLGVRFKTNARVTAIESDGEEVTGVSIGGPERSSSVLADYYVAAVPVEVMSQLLTPTLEAAAPSLLGVKRLDTAWMNGLQFYLIEDLPLAHGHEVYVDSPWALTSISQGQFWKRGAFDIEAISDGSVKGVLSVNISDWETPGTVYGRPARECTPEEIKNEVLSQLTDHLNRKEERLTDEMLYDWQLDPAIVQDEETEELSNHSPLLINTVGSLQHRPRSGTAASNLVLAADYVRTETDLATMESANEAARRAVRVILHRCGHPSSPPRVWGLEEPAILDPIKHQDDLAYKLGVPHPSKFEEDFRSLFQPRVRKENFK